MGLLAFGSSNRQMVWKNQMPPYLAERISFRTHQQDRHPLDRFGVYQQEFRQSSPDNDMVGSLGENHVYEICKSADARWLHHSDFLTRL
jgi:hypothetical protein